VLRTFEPVIRKLGKLSPKFEGSLSANQMIAIQRKLQPGDILNSRAEGEFTNLVIPGFFKHSALYLGDMKLMEAVGDGVQYSSLPDFLSNKDIIGVYRPAWIGAEPLKACEAIKKYLGKKYDYLFKLGTKEFYCSELIYQAYRDSHPSMAFKRRTIFDIETVLPDDFMCVRFWDNIIVAIGKRSV